MEGWRRSPFRRHRRLVVFGMLLAFGIAFGVGVGSCVVRAAPMTGGINDAWTVRGDGQARPVQAFDDGRVLYLQLRNPSEPPAALAADGTPLAYTLRGPYLVLPIQPLIQLRYGSWQATVQATGNVTGNPGVISVTSPVDVIEDTSDRTAAATRTGGSPTGGSPTGWSSVSSVQGVSSQPGGAGAVSASSAVTGQIIASGGSMSVTGTRAEQAGSRTGVSRTVPVTQGTSADLWTGGGRWIIRSDGTAAGARAALDSQAACRAANATCTIDWRGAPAGTLVITENPS